MVERGHLPSSVRSVVFSAESINPMYDGTHLRVRCSTGPSDYIEQEHVDCMLNVAPECPLSVHLLPADLVPYNVHVLDTHSDSDPELQRPSSLRFGPLCRSRSTGHPPVVYAHAPPPNNGVWSDTRRYSEAEDFPFQKIKPASRSKCRLHLISMGPVGLRFLEMGFCGASSSRSRGLCTKLISFFVLWVPHVVLV